MRDVLTSLLASPLSLAVCLPLAIAPSMQGQDLPLAVKATVEEADGRLRNMAVATSREAYPPRPTRQDELMSRAEAMYETGRKLYRSGQTAEARRVFDEAMDLVLNSPVEPVDRSRFNKRFEELVRGIYRLDTEGLDAAVQTGKPDFDKAPIDDILSLTFPVDPKMKRMVREEVAATVSQLPLEASDAVLSFVNYFSGERGRRTLLAGIRRAGRYKPMISRILDEEGIPQEFIFLAQAESGFLPRAVSYMSAGGMWQFVRGRGAEYGLRQDAYVDERFDPELATRAAARHLRDLYHYYGDWYLAIAAYNCGPGNVDKAIERTGYADVWELRSRNVLPLETSNYVPIILAMTIMSKNPDNYQLNEAVPEEPLQYDTTEVNTMTSLALIADLTGQPVTAIKELNPALLKDVAPPGYRLHVPKGTLASLITGLELIPESKRQVWRAHHIQDGEDMTEIARRFSTSVAALQEVNTGLPDELESGALLIIPAAPPPPVKTYVAKRPSAAPKKASRSSKATAKSRVTTSARRPSSAKQTRIVKASATSAAKRSASSRRHSSSKG